MSSIFFKFDKTSVLINDHDFNLLEAYKVNGKFLISKVIGKSIKFGLRREFLKIEKTGGTIKVQLQRGYAYEINYNGNKEYFYLNMLSEAKKINYQRIKEILWCRKQ